MAKAHLKGAPYTFPYSGSASAYSVDMTKLAFSSGDYVALCICFGRDNSAISLSVGSGWTLVQDRTVGIGNTGLVTMVALKKMTGTTESDPTFSTSHSAGWSCVGIVLGGVDGTTPYINSSGDGYAVSHTTSTSVTANTPALTPTDADTLVLSVIGANTATVFSEANVYSPVAFTAYTVTINGCGMHIGILQHPSASVAIEQEACYTSAVKHWCSVAIAFSPAASTAGVSKMCKLDITPEFLFGVAGAVVDPAISWSSLDTLAAFPSGKVAGIDVSTTLATTGTSGEYTTLARTPAAGTRWEGGCFAFTADWSSTFLSIVIQFSQSSGISTYGPSLFLADSGGDYAVLELVDYSQSGIALNLDYGMVFNSGCVLLESSANFSWNDIAKIGFGWPQSTTSVRTMYVKWLERIGSGTKLFGGQSADPVNTTTLANALIAARRPWLANLQGVNQLLSVIPFQFGNRAADVETYLDQDGCPLELPIPWDGLRQTVWNGGANSTTLLINALSGDTFLFSAPIYNFGDEQNFQLAAASDTDVTVNFSGNTLIGFAYEDLAGIDTTGGIWSECDTAIIKGDISGAVVRRTTNATTPVQVTASGITIASSTISRLMNTGASATYHLSLDASVTAITINGTTLSDGTVEIYSGLTSGTLTITVDGSGTTIVAGDVTFAAGTATASIAAPTYYRGLNFTGLVNGSKVKVFTAGSQTVLYGTDSVTGNAFAFDDSTSGATTVDYTIQKAGYVPIRVTGAALNGSTVQATGRPDTAVNQVIDRAYVASSGLTYSTTAVVTVGTNPTTNPGTKTFQLTTASTGQNWYSFWIEQWIDKGDTGEALANVEFPLAPNGPNSFTLNDGWTFSDGATSIAFLTRDGLRYLNTSDVLQKAWAAILTSGVPSGKQVRYQQSDAGTTVNAVNTGEMDQLVQIYDVGVFDYRGYLVLKVQAEGYDQAESNVVTLYGQLEDQLYVVGLTPTANTVAAGNPTVTLTLERGTYNDVTSGKTFGIKIVSADSGTDIMRELRYNFGAGGEYPAASGYDGFDWHDLVQQNGSDFKTVRGNLYGTAAVKGVVVYSTGTTLHPDFTLFTADDGSTYAPVIPANAESTVLANTRVQLYNVTTATEIDNVYVAGTAYSYTITTEASVGDTLRLRVCKKGRQSDEVSAVWAAGGVTFLVSQPEDTVYTAWGIDGDTVTEYSFDNGNLQIDANDVDGSSQKARIGVWYSAAMGSSTSGVGIASFFGALTFLSTAAIRVNVDVADMKLDNTNALVALTFTDLDVRLYRSDGSTIIAATSYTIHNDYSGVPDTVVTSDQSLNLATAEQAIDNKLSTISFSVWSYVTEGAITAVQAIRGMAAILMGKVSGAGTGTETFRDLADTKDRVVATVDTDGNRTAITRDLT